MAGGYLVHDKYFTERIAEHEQNSGVGWGTVIISLWLGVGDPVHEGRRAFHSIMTCIPSARIPFSCTFLLSNGVQYKSQ